MNIVKAMHLLQTLYGNSVAISIKPQSETCCSVEVVLFAQTSEETTIGLNYISVWDYNLDFSELAMAEFIRQATESLNAQLVQLNTPPVANNE